MEAGRYARGRSFEGVSPFTGCFPPHLTSCRKVRHQTQQPGDGLILPDPLRLGLRTPIMGFRVATMVQMVGVMPWHWDFWLVPLHPRGQHHRPRGRGRRVLGDAGGDDLLVATCRPAGSASASGVPDETDRWFSRWPATPPCSSTGQTYLIPGASSRRVVNRTTRQ